MKINYLEIPKASLEKIRAFISEAEEKVLLEMYGIEFVSLDEYETIQDLLDAWKNSINELGIKYSEMSDKKKAKLPPINRVMIKNTLTTKSSFLPLNIFKRKI